MWPGVHYRARCSPTLDKNQHGVTDFIMCLFSNILLFPNFVYLYNAFIKKFPALRFFSYPPPLLFPSKFMCFLIFYFKQRAFSAESTCVLYMCKDIEKNLLIHMCLSVDKSRTKPYSSTPNKHHLQVVSYLWVGIYEKYIYIFIQFESMRRLKG